MTITEEQPAAAAPSRGIDRWTSFDRLAGLVLALGWLGLVIALLVVGERPGSYPQLAQRLAMGEVTRVEVVGARGPAATGSALVTLRWRDGLVTRTTMVTQSSNARTGSGDDDGPRVIVGSVEEHLESLGSDVRVVRSERREYSFSTYDWYAPGGLVLLHVVLLVSTLGLISGPRPWRATRWAWAWLVLLAPAVGVPAYLLFGGPTGLFRPRPPARVWLTGGWALLLALLLGGAASS